MIGKRTYQKIVSSNSKYNNIATILEYIKGRHKKGNEQTRSEMGRSERRQIELQISEKIKI